MTKKTVSVKHSLLTSAISMLLCISMLVGTTFAWFTDSVTSANNLIQSGNLDISLEYWNGTAWVDVQGASEILDKDAKWEPGYTEMVYLKIENLGSLALKYLLGINIISETPGVNAAGETFKLSDYIYFNTETFASFAALTDRADALDLAGEPKLISEGFQKSGALAANSAPVYVAMSVYMPSTVGNDANHNGVNVPSISLGINIAATQDMVEADDFGTDYDNDAEIPSFSTVIVPENTTESTPISKNDVSTKIPASAPAGTYVLEVSNKNVTTNDSGKTTVDLDITLFKDGAKVTDGTTVYDIEIFVGKALEVSNVTHKGSPINYFYDPDTGIVSFETTGFSPFAIEYSAADEDSVFVPQDPDAAEKLEKAEVIAVDENGNEYTSFRDAIYSSASKLYFKEGVDLGSVTHFDVARDLVIYGNGAFISGGERDLAIDFGAKLEKDITVTVYNLHGIAFWGGRSTSYTANINLYNCNDISRVYINGTSGVNNIALYNCTANKSTLIGDTAVYSNANGSIIIDGCTFTGIGCPVNLNHKVAGEQTVIVRNSTFVDCATEGTAAYYAPIRLYNSVAGANQTLAIPGTVFTYSEGKAPVNGANLLLNKIHDGKDATGSIVAEIPVLASYVAGKNVSYVYTASNADELALLNAKMVDKSLGANAKIKLLADIDFSGKTWTPVDSHADSAFQISEIDGNGYTISNLTVNGQAMFNRFAGFGNVVIKNLTFDNATINNNGINTAIIVGHSYQNVLLDNVDVKNSTVTGGYKVAPLIGTVYNENPGSSITATLKNCDVENVTVNSTSYDFCTTGMVAFVYAGDNDKIEFENCTVSNVSLKAVNVYEAHAAIYTTGSDSLYNEAEGVTVSNVTFEHLQ